MAKPLQSIVIQAPGFYGLNTQDSPTSFNEQFALIAENCIIDQYGRIASRKGWAYETTTNPDSIVHISEFIKTDGTTEVISASASNIYTGTTTLTDITPALHTVTDGLYDAATLNGIHYLFRENEDPLYYDGTTCDLVENHPDYSAGAPYILPQGGIVQAGLGRLWVAKGSVVHWSDLLIGAAWDTGSSGFIDVSKVWPDGDDTITALAVHNGNLIIFGNRQILLYSGANDPATMEIADTVTGIGCIARDSVQITGTDILFLSDSGVRSLARTIQEKSAPIGDLSKNVRSDLLSFLASETGHIFSVYSPEEACYLLHLPTTELTYYFDTRTPIEDGSYRTTVWNTFRPQALCRRRNGDLLVGKDQGIAKYTGYTDNGNTYQMTYFTNYLDFQSPSTLKLLKNLKVTIVGGSDAEVVLQWGYDYSYAYKKKRFVLASQTIAEYNIAEYNEGEFNAGILINRPTVNASGGGQVVQFGIETDINGSAVSIQRMTAQAIVGRTI